MSAASRCPRIIWTLWLQGWRNAPPLVKACLESWRRLNQTWQINALSADTLRQFLPADIVAGISSTPDDEIEAFSDRLRIELLARYGGVWVDATTVCAQPLDQWLPAQMPEGFFAFAHHRPERVVASWFLAAEVGSYTIEAWRKRATKFWANRATRGDNYFWFHQQFAELSASDDEVRRVWGATPKINAIHELCFGPNDPRLMGPASSEYNALLASPPSAVFKLSHKQERSITDGSVADLLCQFARGEHPAAVPSNQSVARHARRILVAWYGSFPGHGTIGDQHALESTVTRLVGRGHHVWHASAWPVNLPGAERVEWQEVPAASIDHFAFVCGPLLDHHPQADALFQRFSDRASIAVAVSNEAQRSYFDQVLDRGAPDLGDVAIVAPITSAPATSEGGIRVVLRGPQTEYGADRCLSDRASELIDAAAHVATARLGHAASPIENKLSKTALSADEIDRAYASSKLVVTTRFHGAMISLRHLVPFIAVDQIAGGAKVSALLERLSWPHLLRADQATADTARAAADDLCSGANTSRLHHARTVAVRLANNTLSALDAAVDAPRTQQRYLFVCGCPRSGTSATRHLLAEDHRIVMGSERFGARVARLSPSLFARDRFYRQEPGDCGYDIATTQFKYHDPAAYFANSQRWFDRASLVGDKIPYLYKHLAELGEQFPGAKVVITLRSIHEVAQSYQRRLNDADDRLWDEAGIQEALTDWNSLFPAISDAPSSLSIYVLPYRSFFIEGLGLEELYDFLELRLTEGVRADHERHVHLARSLANERRLQLSSADIDLIRREADFDGYQRTLKLAPTRLRNV